MNSFRLICLWNGAKNYWHRLTRCPGRLTGADWSPGILINNDLISKFKVIEFITNFYSNETSLLKCKLNQLQCKTQVRDSWNVSSRKVVRKCAQVSNWPIRVENFIEMANQRPRCSQSLISLRVSWVSTARTGAAWLSPPSVISKMKVSC